MAETHSRKGSITLAIYELLYYSKGRNLKSHNFSISSIEDNRILKVHPRENMLSIV